jgi:hypothetical protein
MVSEPDGRRLTGRDPLPNGRHRCGRPVGNLANGQNAAERSRPLTVSN